MSRKHKKHRKASAASRPNSASTGPTAAGQSTPEAPVPLAPQEQAEPVLAAVVTVPGVLSLLEVLSEQTGACIDVQDWARLGELAQQPLDQYSRQEQEDARAQLLYMQMLSRIKGQVGPGFTNLEERERVQIRGLLRQFEALHSEPLHCFGTVFNIYINTVGCVFH